MTSSRQLRLRRTAGLLACCAAFHTARCEAQLYEFDTAGNDEAAMSELVGYHPTECEESISEIQVSLLAAEANAVPQGAGWGTSGTEEDGTEDVLASSYSQTLNGLLTPMIPGEAVWREQTDAGSLKGQVRPGLPIGLSRRNQKVLWQAGPLAFDVNSVSAVALYSELNGPGASRFPDAGFLGGLLFNMELMVHVSDSTYLHLRATPYYLFTENRLGLSLGDGGLSTAGILSYTTYLRDWEIKLEDRAGVYTALHDLLDEMEVDEIAVSGRHRLGRLDLTSASPFNDEDLYFLNSASVKASNWLDRDWKIRLTGERRDSWKTTNFEKRGNINRLGAAVFYDSPDLWFMPWASYDWYDINDSQLVVQQAILGVTLPFTPRFQVYAKAEGTWSENDQGQTRERPGWEAGMIHRVTSALSHSLFAGSTFYIDEVGDPFMGSYWRYSLRYAPRGGRFSASAFTGQLDNELTDYQSTTIGGRLEQRFSNRTSLSLYGAVTEGEFDGTSSRQSRLARLTLAHKLTRSLTSRLVFQILERDSSLDLADFDEQLAMLILQWNL